MGLFASPTRTDATGFLLLNACAIALPTLLGAADDAEAACLTT